VERLPLSSDAVRPAPTRFVILTKSRSGSKWLVELLDDHNGVSVFGEVFGGSQVPRGYGSSGVPHFDTYLERVRLRQTRPLAYHRVSYVRNLYASRPDAAAVGFKVAYGHVPRELFAYFARRRVRVLHLMRANFFDSVLSYEVAKARGGFEVRRGDLVAPVRVTLGPGTLRKRLEDHEFAIAQARCRIQRYRLSWLDVFYEELVARREETLGRVLRFLGVEPHVDELRSSFAPVDDVPREDVVENLADVRRVLAGTRFEWMLADPAGAESTRATR